MNLTVNQSVELATHLLRRHNLDVVASMRTITVVDADGELYPGRMWPQLIVQKEGTKQFIHEVEVYRYAMYVRYIIVCRQRYNKWRRQQNRLPVMGDRIP